MHHQRAVDSCRSAAKQLAFMDDAIQMGGMPPAFLRHMLYIGSSRFLPVSKPALECQALPAVRLAVWRRHRSGSVERHERHLYASPATSSLAERKELGIDVLRPFQFAQDQFGR